MSTFVRIAGLLAVLLMANAGASAATPQEIEAAKKKGSEWLRTKYQPRAETGTGIKGLVGIAMLESGVPGADPAMKSITDAIRKEAWFQTRTYEVSLCLMYLDRYGEPSDIPLIQVLAVRLLVGQTSNGGWTYECGILQLPPAEMDVLRAMKAPAPGKLHPEVEKYAQTLFAFRAKNAQSPIDDNSNTQFAVIAVWLARKHGVPVDGALDLIEKRFRATQAQDGGWVYNAMTEGSPSMYCAGLIGLATGIGRREERRLKSKPEPKAESPKSDPGTGAKKTPDDPFFNPKATDPKVEPKKGPPPRVADPLDRASNLAFAGLGVHLAESAKAGRGALTVKEGVHGRHDMYFLWSVERVGVLYGVEKIGGVNWYEAGAHTLVHSQSPEGAWLGKDYGDEVNTSFAVLFLCKSNLVRDLSGKVQKEATTEMRAGIPNALDPKTTETPSGTSAKKDPLEAPVIIPGPMGSDVAILASELLRASEQDWGKTLTKLRDGKGAVNTQALVSAAAKLDGEKRKAVRDALSERLTRMNAETLRSLAKGEEAELRRAAVLAMAMKDDKAHIPDLIAAITDEEEIVVRAAKAGLKSLTSEDFGPAANATAGEKRLAAADWQRWLSKQKK